MALPTIGEMLARALVLLGYPDWDRLKRRGWTTRISGWPSGGVRFDHCDELTVGFYLNLGSSTLNVPIAIEVRLIGYRGHVRHEEEIFGPDGSIWALTYLRSPEIRIQTRESDIEHLENYIRMLSELRDSILRIRAECCGPSRTLVETAEAVQERKEMTQLREELARNHALTSHLEDVDAFKGLRVGGSTVVPFNLKAEVVLQRPPKTFRVAPILDLPVPSVRVTRVK